MAFNEKCITLTWPEAIKQPDIIYAEATALGLNEIYENMR